MADISTVNYDSEIVTDKNKIPEVFNDHFDGVGEKLAKDRYIPIRMFLFRLHIEGEH